MEAQDLIKHSARKVRHSKTLMPAYIELYTQAFSIAPRTCCGGYNTDFKKFVDHVRHGQDARRKVLTPKNKNMGQFKLKRKFLHKILTYRMDGRPFRVYGKLATNDFLAAFLTYGTKDQLENRKAMFEEIPKGWKPDVRPWSETSISKTKEDELQLEKAKKDGTLNLQQMGELNIAEIKAYAKGQGITVPKKHRKKADIMAYVLNAAITKEPKANGDEEE